MKNNKDNENKTKWRGQGVQINEWHPRKYEGIRRQWGNIGKTKIKHIIDQRNQLALDSSSINKERKRTIREWQEVKKVGETMN